MTATHQKHDHSGRCPCRTCRPLHPWWPRRYCRCCRLQTPPACSQGGSSSWASQASAGGVLWLKQFLSYDHLSSASSQDAPQVLHSGKYIALVSVSKQTDSVRNSEWVTVLERHSLLILVQTFIPRFSCHCEGILWCLYPVSIWQSLAD